MSDLLDLLGTEQTIIRARRRREWLAENHDTSRRPWSSIVEGWSGDRQVFGYALNDTADLHGSLLLARAALNIDSVVVFSDARIFTPDRDDPADMATYDRYMRGELSLADLALQGHPRVIDLLMVLPYRSGEGLGQPQVLRYLTKYGFGRETGVIWDSPEAAEDFTLSGRVPEALESAMSGPELDAAGEPLAPGASVPTLWDALDGSRLDFVADMLSHVSDDRFVILNAHEKIAAASGLSPAPASRIVRGRRTPEMMTQLIARRMQP